MRNKPLHFLRVAGNNDREPVAIIVHLLEQYRDSLGAIIARVRWFQGISLIDKEYAIKGLANDFKHFGCRRSHMLTNQTGAIGFDQVSFLEYSELLVNPADDAGHRGFPGAGIAGEHQMVRDIGNWKPSLFARLLDFHKVCHLAHLFLDRIQADQRI